MPPNSPAAPDATETPRTPSPSSPRGWVRNLLRSFRTQVALGFGGLAAVLVVTLSLALGSIFAQKSEADESAVLRAVAQNAAKALSGGLTSRTREIELLAATPWVWQEGLSGERVAQSIARTQALTPYSAWIGVVSPEGVVQTSTGKLLIGANVAERPWFQEGLRGTHVGDVHPAKLLASLLPKGSDGGPQRFVDFASPIRRDGQLVGVLGMHGSWEWTRSVIESLFPDDAVSRRLEVLVLDANDRVIYASDANLDQAATLSMSGLNPNGAVKFAREASGGEFLVATAAVGPTQATDRAIDLGWTVVAREPAEVARAAAREGVRKALTLGMLAAALAFFLGWLLAERLTRPLRQIASVAKAIGTGRLDTGIPITAGSSEVKQLSLALAGMTARLVGANAELEERVRERTLALETANAELDRQAHVDALTGLLNRHGMEERLLQTLPVTHPDAMPLGIVMIDIDHFKSINDRFGHATGDIALREVAGVLKSHLRKSDIAARLGGEEFVLMLPGASATEALRMATALVELVAHTAFDTVGQITVSCGVAQMTRADDKVDTALRRADKALYEAKAQGRNRAQLAAPD